MSSRGGLQSSAFELPVILNSATIDANDPVLVNDIVITKELINGDSGVFRVWFAFTTVLAQYEFLIKYTENAIITQMKLNADNNFELLNEGLYRFDIPVRPGQEINFLSSEDITLVRYFQIQKISIGV